MFYKKCDKCVNKTCLKTKSICKSMDEWLEKYGEVKMGWREKLGYSQDLTQTLTQYGDREKHRKNSSNSRG